MLRQLVETTQQAGTVETKQRLLEVAADEAVRRRNQPFLREQKVWQFQDRYGDLMEELESPDPHIAEMAMKTAVVMSNQQKFLEGMRRQHYGEATVMQSLGDLAPRVIDIVRVFYPNQIVNLIADIQPLTSQVGEILTIKPIFSSTGGGVNAGQELFTTPTDGTYASDQMTQTLGTGNASTTNFTLTLSMLPVKPGTFQVFTGGTSLVGTDNGSGTVVGSTLSGTNTINYGTGAISITFTTAPASGTVITVVYRFDLEQNPENLREVEIGLNLIPVQAKEHPLRVRWSVPAALAAQAQYSLDVQDTVSNLAAFQLN